MVCFFRFFGGAGDNSKELSWELSKLRTPGLIGGITYDIVATITTSVVETNRPLGELRVKLIEQTYLLLGELVTFLSRLLLELEHSLVQLQEAASPRGEDRQEQLQGH